MRTLVCALMTLGVLLALPADAAAYIGPGAGLAVIGTVLAVIGAVFLFIVGFVWYPLKRLSARLRGAHAARER